MLEWIQNQGPTILQETLNHIKISYSALALAIVVSIALGIILAKKELLAKIILSIVGMLQTVPTLAMLALMIPLFGIGLKAAIVALFIYSILPILRNTYDGIRAVDNEIIRAGRGMGMTNAQILFDIELPLAFPVIMAGVKLSAVYVISGATLASYIGAGGLGSLVFNGMELFQFELVLAGAIPALLLVVVTLKLLDWVEQLILNKSGVKSVYAHR